MKRFILAIAATSMLQSASAAMQPSEKTPPMRPARDGDIAIHEELCAARKAATLAAYDLFIARHPKHALADVARAERSRLAGQSNR